MTTRELRERIRRRARYANLNIQGDLLEGLERYFLLLGRWNAKVNLTAFRLAPGGDDEAIDRLLLEPLVAAKHLPAHATSLLDAGSGGGSPAIPLKLAVPSMRLRMVEAKTRKAVFLREAVRELGLKEADVETARFEELLPRPEMHESADVVSLRAVRVEPKVLITLQAFLKPAGLLFLFRGPAGGHLANAVTPPLVWKATYPLVDTLRSRLVVLEKVRIGPQ
jgi:16S rRNA (guanine527-N7)-methyltransferase